MARAVRPSKVPEVELSRAAGLGREGRRADGRTLAGGPCREVRPLPTLGAPVSNKETTCAPLTRGFEHKLPRQGRAELGHCCPQ